MKQAELLRVSPDCEAADATAPRSLSRAGLGQLVFDEVFCTHQKATFGGELVLRRDSPCNPSLQMIKPKE